MRGAARKGGPYREGLDRPLDRVFAGSEVLRLGPVQYRPDSLPHPACRLRPLDPDRRQRRQHVARLDPVQSRRTEDRKHVLLERPDPLCRVLLVPKRRGPRSVDFPRRLLEGRHSRCRQTAGGEKEITSSRCPRGARLHRGASGRPCRQGGSARVRISHSDGRPHERSVAGDVGRGRPGGQVLDGAGPSG